MVWTPIPDSVAASIRNIVTGPLLEVLWRLFVLAVLLAIVAVLVAIGGFLGPFLAATLLAALISDDVRAAVRDVWRRDFWRL